ncbi:hypothetical protein Poly41_17850 [Novipirellula artificiosorum]|uniref:Uncharacterized protein n=2 Tax=Novipirellula artificiosorum TaxID=2528016 RepID=A0A5C6DW44_9BACT|nr:hypothetical protein Poly41_17850 [Novipirellula artificiosorum]
MSCVHLRKLYDLCTAEGVKLGGSDLVRFVCTQCDEQEVCPSILMEEYEATHHDEDEGTEDSSEQAEN